MIISLAAANRDSDRYRDAESFDITRIDSSHLAFGHGIHHCLGARLARLEGMIAFTTLLTRFPAMRLAVPPSALRWNHGDGLVLRGLTELPVILGPSPYPPPPIGRHSLGVTSAIMRTARSRNACGLIFTLQPLAGAATAIAVFGEPLVAGQAAGGALILTGLLLLTRERPANRRPDKPPNVTAATTTT